MGKFANNVKTGAGYTLGNILATVVVLGVALSLLVAGYGMFKKGSDEDAAWKKVVGIVLMVVGAIPLLGSIASGFAVGAGWELGSSFFDDT